MGNMKLIQCSIYINNPNSELYVKNLHSISTYTKLYKMYKTNDLIGKYEKMLTLDPLQLDRRWRIVMIQLPRMQTIGGIRSRN